MKVKWLIEHFDDINGTKELAHAAEKLGYPVKLIAPWEPTELAEALTTTFGYAKEEFIIFQGSFEYAGALEGDLPNWKPCVWWTSENYDCCKYYAVLGEYLVNQDYQMLPFAEFYRRYEYNKEYFIRPSKDHKIFSGTLINPMTFDHFYRGITNCYLFAPKEMVVFSSPKMIKAEWRFVVVDKKVVTGCQYREEGKEYYKEDFPQSAFDLAQKIAEKYQPDPVFTIDIGLEDGEYGLVEINTFSCAGLYKCDMEKIVEAVSAYALKEFEKGLI